MTKPDDIAAIAAPGYLALDWIEEVLASTDPENPESYYCDHPRECAESIAFDVRRAAVIKDVAALRAHLERKANAD